MIYDKNEFFQSQNIWYGKIYQLFYFGIISSLLNVNLRAILIKTVNYESVYRKRTEERFCSDEKATEADMHGQNQ